MPPKDTDYPLRPPSVPHSRQELLARARGLGGLTLAELAQQQGRSLPPDLRRHKGLVGQLVERALGIEAGNRSGPDVPELGVEIKTLPLNARGEPAESTFVCTIRLSEASAACWEGSPVQRKLGCVLWIPIQAVPSVPLAARRVGSAFLWTPSAPQWRQLRADWTDLMGELGRLGPEAVRAHAGHWLQVRPKAAHAGVRTRGVDDQMAPVRVPPRGFYLRAKFTAQLLRNALAIGS